jgi:dihydroorotase
MLDIVFKQATIVNGDEVVMRDVGVQGSKIELVAPSTRHEARKEIDCTGFFLLPGAIDIHVHLREPGMTDKEDIESGTRAGALSGVTTCFDMPNTIPPTTTVERFLEKVEIARRKACCNVKFFMALSREEDLKEIEKASKHEAFAGVKVFLGSTTASLLLSEIKVLEKTVQELDVLFAFHSEVESHIRHPTDDRMDASMHHILRPTKAVVEGLCLILELAKKSRARLHVCHVSSKDEVSMLKESWASRLSAEVTPHHLFFTCEDTKRLTNLLKVNPPVRTREDRDALLSALKEGIFSVIASDHAPHLLKEKAMPYAKAPSGVPGLDTIVPFTLHLVQENVITLPKAQYLLSTGPARIARLHNKGLVAEGFDADLILCDLQSRWHVMNQDILSKCGWSPFASTLCAKPVKVFVMGREV